MSNLESTDSHDSEVVTVYIYGLVDPRDESIFYVGKTVDVRSRKWSPYNSDVAERFLAIRKSGGKHYYRILEEIPTSRAECVVNSDVWVAREKFWIDSLRSQGVFLLNRNNGGGGASFSTEEQRIKQSNALKGRKKPPRTSEHIKNLTAAVRAYRATPEGLAERACTQKKVWEDEDYKNKMIAAKKRSWGDPEKRQRMLSNRPWMGVLRQQKVEAIQQKISSTCFPNKRAKKKFLAEESISCGHGGQSIVAEAAGLCATTILNYVKALNRGDLD